MSARWRSAHSVRAASEPCSSRAISVAVYSTFGGTALTVAAAFGFQVLIPQYMQRVLGYGAAEAGAGVLPAAVVIGAFSVGLSARVIARFGLRVMLMVGLAPIVAGFALLTRLPVAGS